MGQNSTRASLTTSQIENPSSEDIEKYQLKRTKIVTEIIETEKYYVNSLTNLNEKWEKPLRECLKNGNPILSEQDIKTIFSIAEGLLCLHQLMLKALCTRLEQWSKEQIIGDIFLQNGNALKLYAEYVNQYNNGVVLLNKRQKEKGFEKFLKDNGGLMALSSLLIQPVQRIPRYQMLLTDLVKNTWTTHDDYTRLSVALGMIIEAAIFVNEQKRRSEFLERILEIQTTLNEKSTLPLTKYSFYEAHRTIVQEGEVLKQKSDGKKHPIGFCLMSDKLLLWEKRSGKVYILADLKELIATPNQQEFSINITYGRQIISIEFPTEDERDRWYNTFKETKDQEQNVPLGFLTEDDVSHQFALRQVSPKGTGKSTSNTIKKLRPSESIHETSSEPPPRVPLPNDLPETDRRRILSESVGMGVGFGASRFHSYSIDGTSSRASLSEDPPERPAISFLDEDMSKPPARPPPVVPPPTEVEAPPPPPSSPPPSQEPPHLIVPRVNEVKGTTTSNREEVAHPTPGGSINQGHVAPDVVPASGGVISGGGVMRGISGSGPVNHAGDKQQKGTSSIRHGVPLPGMIPRKEHRDEEDIVFSPTPQPIPIPMPIPTPVPIPIPSTAPPTFQPPSIPPPTFQPPIPLPTFQPPSTPPPTIQPPSIPPPTSQPPSTPPPTFQPQQQQTQPEVKLNTLNKASHVPPPSPAAETNPLISSSNTNHHKSPKADSKAPLLTPKQKEDSSVCSCRCVIL